MRIHLKDLRGGIFKAEGCRLGVSLVLRFFLHVSKRSYLITGPESCLEAGKPDFFEMQILSFLEMQQTEASSREGIPLRKEVPRV